MRILVFVLGLLLSYSTVNSVQAEQLVSGISDLTLTRHVTGLNQPTGAVFLPDGRLVIMEYDGDLRVQLAGGSRLISAGTLPVSQNSIEQGALGIAVDPLFASSQRLYFYYSRGSNRNDRHAIGWATIDSTSNQVDVNNITNVLTGIYGPANHNGGGLKFGPDGYLYIGTGDTGCNCGCSPGQADNYNSTCLTNFQGKILRIDRDGNIPASNPLVNVASVKACPVSGARPCQRTPPSSNNMTSPAPEIYNWGFRNAWRFSWDEQTGFLWIGDVGEVTWEEITVSQGPGEHHGWPFREGADGQSQSNCGDSTPSSGSNCVDPAYAYNHSESPAVGSGSVTGGVFSNHCSWPSNYRGKYWFGGFSRGRIWTLTPDAARTGVVSNSRETIVTGAGEPVHFFNGPDHAVYAVDFNFGRIYRVAPSNPIPCDQDAGTNNDDGGFPAPNDSGPGPVADSGGGPTSPDASAIIDAQVGRPDAPSNSADSGPTGFPDAQTSTTGPRPDAGGLPDKRAENKCGCSALNTEESTTIWGLLLLFGLGLIRTKRRQE